MCVGETTCVTLDNANSVVGDGRELDLLFQFDIMDIDGENGKWNVIPFSLKKFKALTAAWQSTLDWNTLFWSNHDQPRHRVALGAALRRRRSGSGAPRCWLWPCICSGGRPSFIRARRSA